MVADVETAWRGMVAWLDGAVPGAAPQLRPPAPDEDLRAVEAAVGRDLPADLAAWWRLADGVDGGLCVIPPRFSPYPALAALEQRAMLLEAWNGGAGSYDPEGFEAMAAVAEREPAGSACRFAWLPSWLPVAGDGGGDRLFADLRPGPASGCVRVFHRDDGASDGAVWPGTAAMLAEIAAGVTADLPVAGQRPWVDASGTLTWDMPRQRWYSGGSAFVNGRMLRSGYDAFVAELRQGGFAPPVDGWSAELIAAHVARNAELLGAVTAALVGMPGAAGELRYDNTDAFAPVVLDAYARLGTAALADRIAALSGDLVEAAGGLDRGSPRVRLRLVEDAEVVVDGPEHLAGVLNALWGRQLPLRARQLRALRGGCRA